MGMKEGKEKEKDGDFFFFKKKPDYGLIRSLVGWKMGLETGGHTP